MSEHRTHIGRPSPEVLRHECTACGGCCEGVRVPLFTEQERDLVRSAARDLGVDDPIDGPAIRMERGRCVFLDPRSLCRIHGELGPKRKPIPCRQFPLIALRTERGLRIGIDPASYGAWSSWAAGEPLPDGPVVATHTPCPGGQEQVESRLVQICEDDGATLPGLLSVLTGEPSPQGELPSGFASRWAQRMATIDLDGFLSADAIGPKLRAGLSPMIAAARTWSPDQPPPWPALPSEREAWAVEAVRRSIYLRMMPGIPNVSAAALLLCGGVVSAAWTDPTPRAFHDALTAWLRAMRFSSLWRDIAQDGPTLMWLATGRRG